MTPSPRTDRYTAAIVDQAIESLANLRGLPCPDDPGTRLHALASLTDQINTTLAAAIQQARRHDYHWDEIADLLGVTTDTAQRVGTPS
jgi:DNA-directed RNA polymerase specialized sigma24 family protein